MSRRVCLPRGPAAEGEVIDASYTMRCDHCFRYLQNEYGTVADYGDKKLLKAQAKQQGWRVFQDGLSVCKDCRERANGIEA